LTLFREGFVCSVITVIVLSVADLRLRYSLSFTQTPGSSCTGLSTIGTKPNVARRRRPRVADLGEGNTGTGLVRLPVTVIVNIVAGLDVVPREVIACHDCAGALQGSFLAQVGVGTVAAVAQGDLIGPVGGGRVAVVVHPVADVQGIPGSVRTHLHASRAVVGSFLAKIRVDAVAGIVQPGRISAIVRQRITVVVDAVADLIGTWIYRCTGHWCVIAVRAVKDPAGLRGIEHLGDTRIPVSVPVGIGIIGCAGVASPSASAAGEQKAARCGCDQNNRKQAKRFHGSLLKNYR
jgi:hypothetical protein